MKLRSTLSIASLLATLPVLPMHAADSPAITEARTLVNAGKPKDAIARIETAMRTAGSQDKTVLAIELARTQVAAGLPISALQTTETALRLAAESDPQKPTLTLLNARLLEANGNFAEALSANRTLAEQTPALPQRADALEAAIRIAKQLRSDDLAQLSLVEFTTAFPKDARSREYLMKLFRIYSGKRDFESAAEIARRYQIAYPNDPAGNSMSEVQYRGYTNDFKGVLTAFARESQRPGFVLNAQVISTVFEAVRREKSGTPLLASLANEYAAKTGDPQFQVFAMELLNGHGLPDQAIALGTPLLSKVAGTLYLERVRIAQATALWRGSKMAPQAESLITAVLDENPTNDTAWNLYREVTSGAGRPDAYQTLLQQEMEKTAALKNVTLRANARSIIRYRLLQSAQAARDTAGIAQHAKAFLEYDGLSNNGPQVIKIFADTCFDGLPDKDKDSAEAVAARAAFESRFNVLLPSLETYLIRTVAWGPTFGSLDDIFKARLSDRYISASAKKFKEMVDRASTNSTVKAELDFKRLRDNRAHNDKIIDAAKKLMPTLLATGGAQALEGGDYVLETLYQTRDWAEVVSAGQLFFDKVPGATGPLNYFTAAAQQLGAPASEKLPAVISAIVAKAGGDIWPANPVGTLHDRLFSIAEQNKNPADMIAAIKAISALQPGSYQLPEYQRKLGLVQVALKDIPAAKATLLAAAKSARDANYEAYILSSLASSIPDSAKQILPLIDDYLGRASRDSQQGSMLLLRAHLLVTELNDIDGAAKALKLAASRPGDLEWGPGNLPWSWLDKIVGPLLSADAGKLTPDQLQLLAAADLVYPNTRWTSDLMLAQAEVSETWGFADSLNRVTLDKNPRDTNALSGGHLVWSQKLADKGKNEYAGLVLRAAVDRFTEVDSKLRAQASQALYSISDQGGFRSVEIDDSLAWAPLLKSAANFRNGDPTAAWKLFQENEGLFAKHQDKLPADYLRWVSDRLVQRGDDESRLQAEKTLRSWIIANENSKAVPDEEKALTQLQLAEVYFKTLRYDLARSEFLSLTNRFPNTPQAIEAQFRIGECYLNQKMYSDAAKVFETLAKTRDKNIASRGEFFLGVLAQQRGDTDDAKARFRNVMDLGPSKDVADSILYRLSELYGQENRFSDELTLLRSIGIIGSSAKQWHTPGMPLNIVIQDADLGVSRGQSYVPVVVKTSGGDQETVRLESGSAGKGFFRAELPTELGDPKPGDNILQVTGADTIIYDYPDSFKKQFTDIAAPVSDIRLASDAEFSISATEIREEEEISFEERLREQRRLAGKQAGLEFRQEFRKGNDLKPGNNIYLQVKDADRDISSAPDEVTVLVTADSGGRVTSTLTETGPHTGVFRGTLPSVEVSANVFASDRSNNNDALRAIDNNSKTSWEGLNDGRAPKFIVVDLKDAAKLGAYSWSTDGITKDKVPVEYAVQVSTDLNDWKTIAATAGFKGSKKELTERITETTDAGVTTAKIDLTGAEGRYVRLFVEKFTGSAPRLAEISVTGASGNVLVPAPDTTSKTSKGNEGLRLTPSDRITAIYQDQTNTQTPDKTRSLTQQLQATYYNGKIGFIAYEYKAVPGRSEPDRFVKQVRRADPGQRVIVSITDYDSDLTDKRDKVDFIIHASNGQEVTMTATETEPFTGVFTKEFDLWSPKNPDGFKLTPGESLEARYLDEQNTDPGAAFQRVAQLDAVGPTDVRAVFVPSSTKPDKNGNPQIVYSPVAANEPAAVKTVAFLPPLTFEIFDPSSAKDSFSEITVTLTTTGGSKVDVICPLSMLATPGNNNQRDQKVDSALEAGRFVGQIFLNLGDKDSPSTSVLELGDTRRLVDRRRPDAQRQQEMANVVPVLNLNGKDIITLTYTVNGKTYTDQARLTAPPTLEFTDNSYETPATELYIGDKLYLAVRDLTADASAESDSVDVSLTTSRGEKFTTKLLETLSHSGEFTGSLPLVAGEKPVPGDDRMEAWFGDLVSLSYGSGESRIEKNIKVVKGTDANLLVFEKKFATEQVAIESQFRMAEAYFELFKNYRALKQNAQADTALAEGMQLLKELQEDYPSKSYEARTDYLLGQFAQELKNYDDAIGYYRRIVNNHSDSLLAPDAQYKLGQCQEEKGDMDAASAEYVTLAYTWPENPLVANVIVRISEYFYNKQEYPAAAEVAKKFVERFPQHEWAERLLFRCAQSWFKADEFVKAGTEFDLLVENYPRGRFRADAMFWAGESYRSANKREEAFRRYKRVTWDYPESDAAKFARGKLVLPEMVAISDNDQAQ